MKRFATFASCALLATLFACHSDQSTTPVSPGSVEGGSKCCTKDGSCASKCTAGANMGAVDGKTCDKPCSGAGDKTCPATGASMGAVEGKSCDTPCTKTCPTTGASMGAVEGKACDKPCTKTCPTTGASMGAVEGKSCDSPCSKSAGSNGAAMGAVSGKSGCCKGSASGCSK